MNHETNGKKKVILKNSVEAKFRGNFLLIYWKYNLAGRFCIQLILDEFLLDILKCDVKLSYSIIVE